MKDKMRHLQRSSPYLHKLSRTQKQAILHSGRAKEYVFSNNASVPRSDVMR